AKQSRTDSDSERDARAVYDAAVDVAPHLIGAEPMQMTRRQQRDRGIGSDRIERSNEIGEDRGEYEHRHDGGAYHAERVRGGVIADVRPYALGARGIRRGHWGDVDAGHMLCL